MPNKHNQIWYSVVGEDMTVGDGRQEELSPAGPAEDGPDHMTMATPPLTDGNSIADEVDSQVSFICVLLLLTASILLSPAEWRVAV